MTSASALADGGLEHRFGTASGRLGAIVALVAGLIAVVNGGLVVAMANGGPGSGNGVVGGAGGLVLGLIAMSLGGLALARSRRTAQRLAFVRDSSRGTSKRRIDCDGCLWLWPFAETTSSRRQPAGAKGEIAMTDREASVVRFAQSTDSFLQLLDGVLEREWQLRPPGEEWSLAETLEHVVLTNRSIRTALGRILASPLPADAPRFDDAAISSAMFKNAGPAPPGIADPKGRFAKPEEGIAALTQIRDELLAWTRATTADLRAHGLPHPVFGVFDGVQWILFAAAHTDNHIPQLKSLRAIVLK